MSRRKRVIQQVDQAVCKLDYRPGLCLYYAHHTLEALHRNGYRAVVQAGSMQWPIVNREDDDGQMDTHFAYMWDPGNPTSAMAVAMGNLPEMHVWVGIIDRQELVDFSTRHFRWAATKQGLTWQATDPPRHLWCGAKQLPDWVRYYPNRDASLLAGKLLQRLFDPAYLRR